MHPFLIKLGVPIVVQDFFTPYYSSDKTGNLVFPYGAEAEHFGFAFHRVPARGMWQAGSNNLATVRHVFICENAMEAISYFTLNFHKFQHMEQCLFMAGNAAPNVARKSCSLIFNNDLFGKVRDLKTAAAIRRQRIAISLTGEMVHIRFKQKQYQIHQRNFSLSAFEKLSGFRFGVRVCKPKSSDCWLDQLKSTL